MTLDIRRLMAWIDSKDRKPAFMAFTAGDERQAAYLVEMAERRGREEAARRPKRGGKGRAEA